MFASISSVSMLCIFWLVLHASPAQAKIVLTTSLGLDYQVNRGDRIDEGNLMVSVGYEPLRLVRMELGVVGSVENGQPKFNAGTELGWEFRPMVVISPPLVPLYGRVSFAGIDVFSQERRRWAYGLAAGTEICLGPVAVFGEVGALPRRFDNNFIWVLEARAGALLRFS